MLQSIRNLVSGWVAVVIFALLIIPFAFWGIDSYFGTGTISAARVNDTVVSLPEYQQTFQRIRQQWQTISPAMAEQPEFIKQQTLDTLVDRLLLLELKDDLGFRVNDNQVRNSIHEIPAFRNPEGFDTVAYQSYLLSEGYTPVRFEAQVRDDMSLQQIQAGLIETLIIPKADSLKLAALQRQSRDFRYAVISQDLLKAGIEVSDAEIQTYYQQHEQEFMSPEEVRLAYIHLSADQIAGDVSVDEESLTTFFESTRQNYSIAERRKVRQILVYTDEENKDRAGEIANEIHAMVTSGTTFDAVKSQYNENTEVTVEVSDFGFINQGVLDTAIDDVVFSLERGAISAPILSEFGHQIVTVDDITGGTSAEFEDVRAEVDLDYRREQAQKRFFELYDELAVLTYEHPDTLEVASETLGLPVIQSGVVTRDSAVDTLLNDPRILSSAFSEEVLVEKNNSDLIEIDSNQVVVIRVDQHSPGQIKPLTDVRDDIVARLLEEKAAEKARVSGEQIRDRLMQGELADTLATEYSLIWNQQLAITRDTTTLDPGLLQLVFKASRPEDRPQIDGTSLANGDYAVILLDVVHDVDPATLTDEAVQPVRNYIQQSLASRSLGLIIKDLREKANVEIFDTNL